MEIYQNNRIRSIIPEIFNTNTISFSLRIHVVYILYYLTLYLSMSKAYFVLPTGSVLEYSLATQQPPYIGPQRLTHCSKVFIYFFLHFFILEDIFAS